jgi:DNA-binding MarR family transcriptional regulator
MDRPQVSVERAMIDVRRRQTRRALAASTAGNVVLFGVLDAVEADEQGSRASSVGSIATTLGVDQPRASRLVARAIEARLLERKADQLDGRRSLLMLTRDGRKQLEAVHEVLRAAFAAAMGDWSPAERRRFASLLTRFVAHLNHG